MGGGAEEEGCGGKKPKKKNRIFQDLLLYRQICFFRGKSGARKGRKREKKGKEGGEKVFPGLMTSFLFSGGGKSLVFGFKHEIALRHNCPKFCGISCFLWKPGF